MKKLLVGLFVFGFLFVGSQVHAAAPDLIITDLSWSPETPTQNKSVNWFAMGMTVKNIGDASVVLPENMAANVVMNGVDYGAFRLGTAYYNLNPGDSQFFDFHTAQSPNILANAGTFDITATIDDSQNGYYPEGLVKESNENNNTLTKKITIVGDSNNVTPSITVLSPNGGETWYFGNTYEVKWEAKNFTEPVMVALISPIGTNGNIWCTLGTKIPVSVGKFVFNLKKDFQCEGSTNFIEAGVYQINIYNGVYPFDLLRTGPIIIREANTTPSITVLTPIGRDMYEVGQQINVTWDSTGIPESSKNIDIILHGYNSNGIITWSKELSSFTLNDGQEKVILPTYLGGVPFGKNFKIAVGTDSTNNSSPVSDFSDTTFTIGPATDVTNGGCSNGEVYSSTSGQKCPGITVPSIKVLSPNGGEVYKEGDIVRVKWTSSNLPADYRINLVFNYLDELKDEYKQSVLITKAEDKGYYDYKLPMFFQYKTSNYPLPGKNYEFTAYLFDSSLFNAPSSNAVAIGSSAHGSNDGFFTINVLNTFTPDTSCSAGAVYSFMTGKKCSEKDEVKDTGCIAGYNYSSMTGKPCALGLYKKDNTDVLNPITNSIKRTLKLGIKGDDVKALQAFLNLLADGSFGPKTQAKVMEWQAANGLTPDGAFGRMSREKAGLTQ